MNYGFFRIASAVPQVTVADCEQNALSIIENAEKAVSSLAKLIVFPELSLTGYTCSDLFFQDTLLHGAKSALETVAEKTKSLDAVIAVGLPFRKENALYNVAAILFKGEILCLIPKSYIPNYAEFYERRHFKEWKTSAENEKIYFSEKHPEVLFGSKILIADQKNPDIKIAFEICEDLWVSSSPSVDAALSGATIIANLSASNEIIGKASYRRTLVSAHSAKAPQTSFSADIP